MSRFLAQYRRVIFFVLAIIAVFWLIWVLRNVLLPFIIGLILAYLLATPIMWIEKRLPRKDRWKGAKRVLLILFFYFIIIAALGLLGFFTIPLIVNSITNFFSNLPEIIPDIVQNFQNWTEGIRNRLPPDVRDQIDTYLSNALGTIGTVLQSVLMTGLGYITASFGLILGFAALPVFLFYLLKDAEKLNQGFYSSMSPWTADRAKGIVGIIRDVLGRYIRAQIILGFTVGILVLIGLLVLRIPFAPFLALWAAITELVPVLGPWLGGAAGVIVTLAIDPAKIPWVIVLYFSVQLLENNFLVPRISGEILQIHPAVILVLLVVGGHFAGIWGIILIVPVTATIVKLYRFIARTTKKEELQGPLQGPPGV